MIPGIVASAAAAGLLLTQENAAPTFADVSFLSSFNGTNNATAAADDSTAAHAITFHGNAKLDTATKKFGTAALKLDGTGDWVSCANDPSFLFGAGPFTLEAFVRLSTLSGQATLFRLGTDVPGIYEFSFGLSVGTVVGPTHYILPQWSFDGDNIHTLQDPGDFGIVSGMSIDTWYHLCFERNDAGRVRCYLDGVMIGTVIASDSLWASSSALTIGALDSGSNCLNGYLDEVRITRGAQYNTSSGFTPPTAEFPRS